MMEIYCEIHKCPFTQAIFVALNLQLQNRTCKPGAIFSRFVAAISQGFRACLKLVATLARQKLHRVAATKIACINGSHIRFLGYVEVKGVVRTTVVS